MNEHLKKNTSRGKREKEVGKLLDRFYLRKIRKLNALELADTMKRERPYLLRCSGLHSVNDIVAQLLAASVFSSDECTAEDVVMEPLAKAVSSHVLSTAQAVDCVVGSDREYKVAAVKSQPHCIPGTWKFRELGGHALWKELTGNAKAYLGTVKAMRLRFSTRRIRFDHEWNKAVNRFTREFTVRYCFKNGFVNWHKLLELNSGRRR